MILLLILSACLAYKVLLRKNHYFLVYLLIPIFAVSGFPSEIKEFFVLHVGGFILWPQDIYILFVAIYLVISPASRRYLKNNWKISLSVLLLIIIDMIGLFYTWVVYGMESFYLREIFFGTICLILSLAYVDVLNNEKSRKTMRYSFVIFNVVTAISVFLIIYFPELNQLDSKLHSAVGFTSTGGEGSIILISSISASICIFSVWFFTFIERKNIVHPTVILPIVLVIVSSHRISYVALAILLLLLSYRYFFTTRLSFRKIYSIFIALFMFASGSLYVVNNQVAMGVITPFYDRAASLFVGSQQGTVQDRVKQINYFFDGYIGKYDVSTYLFGEAYKPELMRDQYYQFVQPHNFVLSTIVNNGFIDFVLLAMIVFFALWNRGGLRSPFLVPFILFMVTQLTDTGFTNYPYSAYFSLLLALTMSNQPLRKVQNLVDKI